MTTVVVGDRFTVQQSGTAPITTWVDAYSWSCHRCGRSGAGHTSAETADREARRHWKDDHGVKVE